MKNEIIIFSGIEPGKKGAGNLVYFFLDRLKINYVEFKLHFNKTPDGFLIRQLKNFVPRNLSKSLYYSFYRFFFKSSENIINRKVILFHPQSIGLELSINLIRNNFVYIYVFDNFLFCRKSYNYIDRNKSCLLCLKDKDAYLKYKCDFFPVKHNPHKYDDFLLTISNNLSRVHFLTQNRNQSNLLYQKFGPIPNLTQIGMMVDMEDVVFNGKKTVKKYDFLYHNTLIEAKGIFYFLSIAKLLRNYSFIVPFSLKEVRNLIPDFEDFENVDFLSIKWNTGLKEILINCQVVINPSLWSAPVEGALLKSIKFNGCVAVVTTEYSFQSEIPSNVVIKLPDNLVEASKILNDVIDSEKIRINYKNEAKKWFDLYSKDIDISFDKFIQEEFN
ncbi:hypothetical protein [Algoriphagus sp.]|uniref:hypothetical protein n=1 Tax=Algoriphagus sp. TaxID=1872435 RepID=UPI0039197C92